MSDRACRVSKKTRLTYDMREVPKANTTTPLQKCIGGTGLITHPNGKKVFDITMDNPQTVPKLAIVRVWNMSQRLPVRWMKRLTNANDSRRYSLSLYESKGMKYRKLHTPV